MDAYATAWKKIPIWYVLITTVIQSAVGQAGRLIAAAAVVFYFFRLYLGFDILWLDGEDLRDKPCVERKQVLQSLAEGETPRLHHADHVDGEGERLFELICQRDMEGIVAKPMASPYRELNGKTPWIKIKNPDYSQAEDRGEMFQVDR